MSILIEIRELYLNKDDVDALWLLVLVWLDDSVGVGASWPTVPALGPPVTNVFSRGREAPRLFDCWSFGGDTSSAVFSSLVSKLLINTSAALSTKSIQTQCINFVRHLLRRKLRLILSNQVHILIINKNNGYVTIYVKLIRVLFTFNAIQQVLLAGAFTF